VGRLIENVNQKNSERCNTPLERRQEAVEKTGEDRKARSEI
jgi:hypothetical protein